MSIDSGCAVSGRLPFGVLSASRCLTNDPFTHARRLNGWRREVVQLGSGEFSGCVAEIGGCGLFAADEFMSQSLFHIGDAYRGGLTLGVVRQHQGPQALWHGQPIDSDFVFCVVDDAEMVLRTYDQTHLQWLFVPWKMLEQHESLMSCLSAQQEAAKLCIRDKLLAERLRSCIAGVSRWAESVVSSPVLAHDAFSSAHREMLTIAHDFVTHYLAEKPVLGAREAHAMRILRTTRAYVRVHIGEHVSIAGLCDAAATSERTLRNACEIITGESPMTFLRAMRLNQVRLGILSATDKVSITRIGTRSGFLHLPQFSKDYRALFGELPSETLRRQLADSGCED